MSEYRLDELCEILDSKRVPLSAMQRAKRKGPYPYYGAQSVIDHVDDYLLDGEYLLVAEDGANLVTRTQDIANLVNGKIWVNNHAHILGYNGKCPLRLLGFLLNNSNISPYVTGCAQPKLNQENLRRITFSLPEKVDEVSSILSSLDSKIENNRKICANLEAQAQALFKHWFIDFAPFRDGKFVESELGMIPEGWRVNTIDDFCRVFTGKKNTNQAENNGKYPFFSCAPNPLKSNDYLYDGYAIIIAGNGSYTGRTQLYNGKFDLYQRTYACVAKERSFDKKIVFFYLVMKQTFEREKMGGTRGSSIPFIVMNDIAKQYFCYNEYIVTEFCNIVRPILDMTQALRIESSRLSTLRDTLLPKLMSGEIKV